jgi:aromatic ring-cleaving dioxygenase
MSQIFHAHIYFNAESRTKAEALQKKAQQEISNWTLGISKLIDRPVGPHPVPMFEIDFHEKHLGNMVDWLYNSRGDLNILIHKDKIPEIPEHTTNAIWLGIPQKLDLSKLDIGSNDVHNSIMKKT